MVKSRATARDVAELAGVSRSAVSLVLNGRAAGNISATKQRAIRAAARRLGYTPNSVAVSLRTQRTRSVGVVTDHIVTTAFGGRMLRGAAMAAQEHGYVLLTVDTDDDPDRERLAFKMLADRQVDGFLFAAMGMHAHTPPPDMLEQTTVLLNCFDPEGRLPSVCADEVAGGRTATELALSAGHRDILMIAGTLDVLAATLRRKGFREAMRAAGLRPRPVVEGGWDLRAGHEAAMTVLDRPGRPTAILAGNDRAAVGIALAAARLGLRIPDDLSLVGYDDDENQAEVMVPPLTTVRLPHQEIGQAGFRLLADVFDAGADAEPTQLLLSCPAVERASVGPPPR